MRLRFIFAVCVAFVAQCEAGTWEQQRQEFALLQEGRCRRIKELFGGASAVELVSLDPFGKLPENAYVDCINVLGPVLVRHRSVLRDERTIAAIESSIVHAVLGATDIAFPKRDTQMFGAKCFYPHYGIRFVRDGHEVYLFLGADCGNAAIRGYGEPTIFMVSSGHFGDLEELFVAAGHPPRVSQKKQANKSLEPTPTAVTIPAAQEVVPAVAVAHH